MNVPPILIAALHDLVVIMLRSVYGLRDAAVLALFTMYVFAILGVDSFMGTFHGRYD